MQRGADEPLLLALVAVRVVTRPARVDATSGDDEERPMPSQYAKESFVPAPAV